jgi:pimeloyl-ACP methyl ester carboxylesterase
VTEATAHFNHHREGRGEPLVLLHGVGHHWQTWKPVIGRLAEHFDVIAVDSPGFGRSLPLGDHLDPTIDAYADAFVSWLEELGLERPHLAGNSMGGAISLELARRGRARSVTAISPAGFWTARERRFCQLSLGLLAHTPAALRPRVRAAASIRLGRTALFAQLFARPWRIPAAEAQLALDHAWASPAFAGVLAAFDRYLFGSGEELGGVPLTVAWGERDFLLPFSRQAPRARAALPWARHVTLSGLGHVPFFDDPGMVSEVVLAGTKPR